MKEVSSDARALGMRAEMKSRRCWEAELESGSGREPREPTNLRRRIHVGKKTALLIRCTKEEPQHENIHHADFDSLSVTLHYLLKTTC